MFNFILIGKNAVETFILERFMENFTFVLYEQIKQMKLNIFSFMKAIAKNHARTELYQWIV